VLEQILSRTRQLKTKPSQRLGAVPLRPPHLGSTTRYHGKFIPMHINFQHKALLLNAYVFLYYAVMVTKHGH